MAAFEAGGQVVSRSGTPVDRRLASDPCDARRVHCGDPVGVAYACSWTDNGVQRVAVDGALVRARHLVPQRDLRGVGADCDGQGVLL